MNIARVKYLINKFLILLIMFSSKDVFADVCGNYEKDYAKGYVGAAYVLLYKEIQHLRNFYFDAGDYVGKKWYVPEELIKCIDIEIHNLIFPQGSEPEVMDKLNTVAKITLENDGRWFITYNRMVSYNGKIYGAGEDVPQNGKYKRITSLVLKNYRIGSKLKPVKLVTSLDCADNKWGVKFLANLKCQQNKQEALWLSNSDRQDLESDSAQHIDSMKNACRSNPSSCRPGTDPRINSQPDYNFEIDPALHELADMNEVGLVDDLRARSAYLPSVDQGEPWRGVDVEQAKQDQLLLNEPGRKTEFGLSDGLIRITPEGGFGNFYLPYEHNANVDSVVVDAMSAIRQSKNKEYSGVQQSWLENQSMFYRRSDDSMLKMDETFQGKEVWKLMR